MKIRLGGFDTEITFKRATNVGSKVQLITITALKCVLCDRETDRWISSWVDGKPHKALPCCDSCHDAIRKLPANEELKPLIIEEV